jgi:uncharacterized membrane protein YbhN (UPF0104 family)
MSLKMGLIKGAQKRWLSSLVVGTIIGTTILAGIVAWVGLDNVKGSFRSLNYTDLVIYIALTISAYLFRAWRFRVLVNRGTISRFYGIVSVHTLMINLLPFSSGDISYPVLLKRYGMSDGFLQGLPSLLIARAQDIFINLSLVIIALTWGGNLGIFTNLAGGNLSLIIGVILLIMGGASWLMCRITRRVEIASWIRALMDSLRSSFREATILTWATTFSLTVVIRLISIVAVYYLFQSVGVLLPLSAVLLITSLYVFLPLLPINTLAGVGITEACVLTLLLISGLDQAASTAASVQVHSLQFGVAAALGAIGLILLQYLKRGVFRNRGRQVA